MNGDSSSKLLRVSAGYLILAALWLAVSEWMLALWIADQVLLPQLQQLMRWLLIPLTALLFYFSVRYFSGRTAGETAYPVEFKGLLQSILNNSSGMAITVKDRQGRYLLVNRECEQIVQRPTAEIIGKRISDFFSEEITQQALDVDNRAILTKQPQEVDMEVETPLGVRFFHSFVFPLFDDNNDVYALCGISHDITDIKATEEQLRKSEELFRRIVEHAPIGIITADQDGNILGANPELSRMLGYSRDEFVNRHYTHFIAPEHVERSLQNRAKLMAGEIPVGELERKVRHKDGHYISVHQRSEVVRDASGNPIMTVSQVEDITERKRYEAELQAARLKAESASATKSRFLATASHDLRQPLQSLTMLNNALLRTVDNSNARRMLEMQSNSLADMTWLLNSLLDTVKLESGKVELMIQDVLVQPLLERLLEEFKEEASQQHLAMKIDADEADIALTDPDLLAQLLRNLISNAIRYTESGYVALACRRQNDRLNITVEDSGIGIPEEELNLIFEEFHQVSPKPHRLRRGLGLGLSIVQRIATMLGTHVDVQSTVGQGTRFSMSLPVSDAAATTGNGGQVADIRPVIDQQGSILLIDDDPAVLEATQLLLSLEGMDVTPAASLSQAYAALESFTPDLIISDFHVGPEDSAFDVVDKANALAEHPVPAIFITGDTSVSLAESDSIKLMTKPVDTQVLLNVTQQMLEGRASNI